MNEQLGTIRKLAAPINENKMYSVDGWDENKNEQRQWLFKIVKRELPQELRVQSLTLPGLYFRFEQLIYDHFRAIQITTCEKNTRTFERGLAYMPRPAFQNAKHGRKRRGAKIQNYRFPWGHVDSGYTRQNRKRCDHFHCDIESFAIGLAKLPGWKNQKLARRMLQRFNIVWLDTVSPIGCEFFTNVINNLHKVLANTNCVVSLSYVVGRDCKAISQVLKLCPGKSAADKRANYIQHVLNQHRDCEIIEVVKHKSAGGMQMATVAIRVCRKTNHDENGVLIK